jgi:hypothetical protein
MVGSLELGATAMPVTPFQTSMDGSHNHGGATSAETSYTGRGIWYDYPYNGQETQPVGGGGFGLTDTQVNGGSHVHAIGADGVHSHSVATGGDSETRPRNVSVNYIIKY